MRGSAPDTCEWPNSSPLCDFGSNALGPYPPLPRYLTPPEREIGRFFVGPSAKWNIFSESTHAKGLRTRLCFCFSARLRVNLAL